MRHRWLFISLAAGVALAAPGVISAQPIEPYRQAQAAPNLRQSPRSPRLDAEDELTPAQIQRAQELERSAPTVAPSRPAAPRRTAQPARVVACSGAFAKDSDHIKLVAAYKSENVEFTEVDAGAGRKVMASVLFPNDPKRRLEVWWRDEAGRKDTYLIVIGGQSTWTAPKGVRLGLTFPALERLNRKPFKLKGLNQDNVGMVSDWQGGALDQLPGGCRLGASYRADPKAPDAAHEALSSDKDFLSSDASVRAVKPTLSEIIVGY